MERWEDTLYLKVKTELNTDICSCFTVIQHSQKICRIVPQHTRTNMETQSESVRNPLVLRIDLTPKVQFSVLTRESVQCPKNLVRSLTTDASSLATASVKIMPQLHAYKDEPPCT